MIQGIDHLVIACADPDAAAVDLESSLGISCAGGGRHVGRGTWNRIAWLADGSYLELIGVDDARLAAEHPIGAAAVRALEEHGGGLATYALAVDNIDATVAGIRAAGSSFGDATHGSRTREDGGVVEWWTAVPARPLSVTGPPFLIHHSATGSEWDADALAERARFAHPIGSPVTLVRLDIAVAEPMSIAADLHRELDLDVWGVADLAVAEVGVHVLRFVPRREMPVPALITLGAEVEAPRTADLLGLRLAVERIDLPVPEPNRA